jgi:hypothetical protein
MSCFAGPYNRGIVTRGLVLYYDVNEPVCYSSGRTDIQDLSRNGNVGTLVNGVGYSANNGGSLVFDGTNDYLSFNNLTTSSLGLTSSNGATLSCWLNITLLSRWTGVFSFWSTAGNTDFGWDIDLNNNLRICKGTFSSSSSLNSYSNIWSYYSLVSNSSGTIFYINSTQFSTSAISGNVPFTAGRNLMFGDNWDNPIQGNSSQIQIYNRALSATEIQQNFNASRNRFGI